MLAFHLAPRSVSIDSVSLALKKACSEGLKSSCEPRSYRLGLVEVIAGCCQYLNSQVRFMTCSGRSRSPGRAALGGRVTVISVGT